MRELRCLLCFLWLTGLLHAEQSGVEPAFVQGEKLKYELNWGMFTAGYCTLTTTPQYTDDGERLSFQLLAKTNGFVGSIYPVDNLIVSHARANLSQTMEYVKRQREGKHKRDERISIHWDKGLLEGWNNEHRFEQALEREELVDPLTAIFRMRMMPELVVGQTYIIPLTDGEHVIDCRVEVLAIEEVDTPAGTFECYKLQPHLEQLRGIFRKRGDAPIYVWLSKDARRLPVMLKSKAPVGSFKVKLGSVK